MRRVGTLACGALLLAAAAACGGGGSGGGTSVAVVAPTPTPTPGPPIVLTASVTCPANANCLQFSSTGSSETFVASEATYAGPLTVTLSGCAQIVSLSSPASVTPSAAGGTATFTLTSVGTGSCSATVNDARTALPESASLTVQVASVPVVLH